MTHYKQTKKTLSDKATPRPWKLVAYSDANLIETINTDHGYVIAKIESPNSYDKSLIVRAVNNHDALVEALEYLKDCYEELQDNEGYPEVPQKVIKALTQAEGG